MKLCRINEKGAKTMELKDTVNGMISEDYKERFIAEYQQLVIRLNKLKDIVWKAREGKLDFDITEDRLDLLVDQLDVMKRYRIILRTRAKLEKIDLNL